MVTARGKSTVRPVYSEVMEDGEVVADALSPAAGETVVSVASAGDNVLRLALSDAARVAGVDVNPVQIELCRLVEAAIAALEPHELQALAGVTEAAPEERAGLLARLPDGVVAPILREPAVTGDVLAGGFVACGELAAFVAPLRAGLAEIVGAEALATLLSSPDPAERRRVWEERFATDAVAGFLDAALNRETIADAFVPAAAWERMAEPRFGLHYHAVLRRLCVEGDPTRNFFLHRLWRGRHPSPEDVPAHLARGNHARLTARLDAVEWHAADLLDFLGGLEDASVDAVNLSNVLDWSTPDHAAALWREVDRVATDGARVFLRSFLRDAELPAEVAPRWSTDAERNEAMARADRVGYFARYELWTRARSRS